MIYVFAAIGAIVFIVVVGRAILTGDWSTDWLDKK
jgi:hypothetical protein